MSASRGQVGDALLACLADGIPLNREAGMASTGQTGGVIAEGTQVLAQRAEKHLRDDEGSAGGSSHA